MHMNIWTVCRSLAVVAVAVLLAAYGGAAQATPPATDGPVVELRDDQFHPAQLEVFVGTTVTWWWNDGIFSGHDLVMNEVFAVPEQTSGTFRHRFDTPGTYAYVHIACRHDGTIIVTAADAGTTP